MAHTEGNILEIQLNNEKKRKINFKGSVAGLLRKLAIRREEVVVKVNGSIAPDDMAISGNDKVEVIRVVFGG